MEEQRDSATIPAVPPATPVALGSADPSGTPVPREPAPVPEVTGAAQDVLLPLTDSPAVVSDARALATGVLLAWGCPEGTRHDTVMVVSELVTNAVLHALPPLQLRLAIARPPAGQVIRVEVSDGSSDPLSPREPTAELPYGRGLPIVDALSVRHGVLDLPSGKTVWAEVPLRDPPLPG